ncbi:MAG: hypothetical protein PWR21_631 [Methanoculleus sp.]|nr:hypothetical protein [Methanoculleus sp.]
MPALALDQRLLNGEEAHRPLCLPDQEIALETLERRRDRTGLKTGGCYQVFDRNAACFGNPVIYGPIQIFLTHTYSFFRADRYSYSCTARTVPALWAGIRAGLHEVWWEPSMVDYVELAELADSLFEASDDDDELLAKILDTLDEETRGALLSSDFLNAYQVFYYYFRETPDELTKERLQLHAASDLARGIVIDEVDIYEVVFSLEGGEPVVILTDGENTLARFSGPEAYAKIALYMDECL